MRAGVPGMNERPVIVSVVDDHPDLCHGVLARLSQASPSFIAGVKAGTVAEFLVLETAAAGHSDVVLLDLTLKDGTSPAENVTVLKDRGHAVVIYTGEERPERLQGTLGIGADAVVRKEEAECLEDALRAVLNGDDCWVSPLMAAVVLVAPGPRLSPAQVEALRLYATGVTTQKVASALGCALETVKSHLKAVKARYEAHGDAVYTRTDLLRVALRDSHVRQDWYLHGQ
jgi:DNA-binding NarL/FixJ family response regulator